MSPDDYATAWRKADADADRRWRQETAQRIESMLDAHLWAGGYHCRCGYPVSMPTDWGAHLLELALFDEVGP